MQEAFALSTIWETMGWTVRGVVLVLFLMSVWSLGLSIERYMRLRKARAQSLRLVDRIGKLLDSRRLADAESEARRSDYDKSHLAKIVAAGIARYLELRGTDREELNPAGAARRAMAREQASINADFRRGLTSLATIATTAPFVGLFGTVVGIINAFRGMHATGSGGLGAVSGGIAEALVATAFGLFVAIPAVWLYNYFIGRIDRFEAEMDNTSSEMVDVFVEDNARTERPHAVDGTRETAG
ncbi:MAG: MotA/TolQ/ExbB proton channel family protein [Acidobacteria bacterium]|nr:MotA/TolQ/ExbB proton channel family protein [Acidobacteriota bacterium]